MNYQDLAWQINNRVRLGIKTDADKAECFALDEKLRGFVETANFEMMKAFKRQCYAHEVFVKIILGLKHDKEGAVLP